MASKLETQIPINAPAEKLYEIFCSNTHHIANMCPKIVQSVGIHEGEWGIEGSIIVWKCLVDGKPMEAKEVVETIDKENNSITFKVLEGHILQIYKSFKFIVQVSPKENGSILNWTMEYEKLHYQVPDPHSLIKAATVMVKDIDANLIQANM
ncbi:hypothetical protein L6164_003240 [Bauhinia variegata]|uniref:Uncharacterized protein n=1 Tax=Bauhinia variegata TaxID=167791 RepID=A0ACB9Q0S9_BAUVA|nr:hypothetical protein L6164_003240 [Bauhinia variegata]